MKDFARVLCIFALLAGNNHAIAFQQLWQGGRRNIVASPLQSQAFPEDHGKNARRSKLPFRKVNSRRLAAGAYDPAKANGQSTKTGIRLSSSVPVELPRSRRFFERFRVSTIASVSGSGVGVLIPPPRALSPITKTTQTQETKDTEKVKAGPRVSKLDVALFMTYFCNMFVINLSVVTIPALSALSFSNPAASAAFESSVASMAPLGGAFGKVVNGFVVQRLGGRRASVMYLVALAALSCVMSVNTSIGAIAMFLVAYEFLSSIQWTAMCSVLDQATSDPTRIARGLTIMSMSSYTGALAAKTVGAALLNMSGCWRQVTQVGALVALVGAAAMFTGASSARKSTKPAAVVANGETAPAPATSNPPSVLKSILTSRLFWMIGIGHALGYVIRGSDRLLVPFLHEATGFPRHICASLTSSITLGFVLGLGQGTTFAGMKSISDKMKMLKSNYYRAIGSFLGLGVCALNVMHGWIRAPYIMAAAISLLSGVAASSISFQFSQFPNLVATNVFPENKAVALSLVDAAGFFVTSQILTVNTRVLSTFGWSASWTFLALFLGAGTTLIMKNLHPILATERRNLRPLEA